MEYILFSVEQGVATLTFNRPAQKNAVTAAMRAEILEAVEQVRHDRAIRALILTGAGGNFCSGGDLRDIATATLDNEGWRNRMQNVHLLIDHLINLDRPVIAAVDGFAVGAGFSLALTADFILATPRARFGMAFLRAGLMPDYGALYTLPRVVGAHRAKEIMLSTRQLSVDEAQRLGIVFEIHAPETLLARAQTLAQRFVQAPAMAVSLTKRVVNASLGSDLPTMLELEASGQALAFGTDYHREAVARFVRKEAPLFNWPDD